MTVSAAALRVLTSLASGVATLAVMLFPFQMGLWAPVAAGTDVKGCLGFLPPADPSTSLVGKLCEAANTYTGFSINAFNLWRNPWTGLGDTLFSAATTPSSASSSVGCRCRGSRSGPCSSSASRSSRSGWSRRRDDIRGIVLSALLLAITFFALPTRVHERYLFPALALGALLLFSGRIWPWLYGAISVVFFANIYWLYSEDWSFITDRVYNPGVGGLAMVQDAFLQSTLFTDAGIWLLGLPDHRRARRSWPGSRSASRCRRARQPSPRRSPLPTSTPARAPSAPRLPPPAVPPGSRRTRPMRTCASPAAGSIGATRSSSSGWWPSRSSSASGASICLALSTSTRPTTPARRPSS